MAIDLHTLKHPPLHCDNPIGPIAFLSFALWLAKQPEAVTDFRDKTNIRLPVSALDRMIDEATGHDAAIASEWLSYASRWHWGCTCCPNEAH